MLRFKRRGLLSREYAVHALVDGTVGATRQQASWHSRSDPTANPTSDNTSPTNDAKANDLKSSGSHDSSVGAVVVAATVCVAGGVGVTVNVAVIDDVANIVCDALIVEVAEAPKLDEAVEEAVAVTLLVAVEHDNSSQGPSNSSATKPGPPGMPTPSRQNGEAGFRGCDDESAEMLTIVPGKRPGAHDVPPRPDSPELMPCACQPPPLPAV
jgi:hypothetical protein